MKPLKLATLLAPVVATAANGQLTATIEIPQLDVAEYHRPYVAAWIETPDRSVVTSLAVWYDTEMPDLEGETWLKDIRQWWRKTGRSQKMPIDGVSSPTRPVGTHEISLDLSSEALAAIEPGEYSFVVEAAREVGGRELIRIPFTWTDTPSIDKTHQGERELGTVTFKIKSK